MIKRGQAARSVPAQSDIARNRKGSSLGMILARWAVTTPSTGDHVKT